MRELPKQWIIEFKLDSEKETVKKQWVYRHGEMRHEQAEAMN